MAWIPMAVNAGLGIAQSIWGRGGGGAAREDYSRLKTGQDTLGDLSKMLTSYGKEGKTAADTSMIAGQDSLARAKNYWTNLLSGSRPAMMAAAAPEINSINESSAGQRATESAYGTARGGGTSGANQLAETNRLTDVNKALFGVRPEAAKQTAAIGETQLQASIQQMANALRSIGLSEDAVRTIVQSAYEARTQSAEINKNTWRNIGQAVGAGESAIGQAFPKLGW